MDTELLSSVGPLSVRPLSLPGELSSGATSHTRNTAHGHYEKQQNGSTQGERRPTTIDALPDDVLLEIFDFYRKDHKYTLNNPVWKWHLPRQSRSSRYTTDWLHFTRGNGHVFGHIAQVGLLYHRIPIGGHRSPVTSRPDRIHPPPVTRTILPALTSFEFKGASKYLEDLVSRIDSPRLNKISIDYLRLVDYRVTQLSKFIDRSVGPKLTLPRRAPLQFYGHSVAFTVYPHLNPFRRPSDALVLFQGCNWRVLDMGQLLGPFPTLTNVVHLNLGSALGPLNHQVEDMGDVNWLHLLRQFSTTHALRLYLEPAVHVPLALEDLPGELVAEVLPSLDFICMVSQPASSIKKFIAARKLSGCPVTVVLREMEFDEIRKSYARTRD